MTTNKNNIAQMQTTSQIKESLIRALAHNDAVHAAAGGQVENITGEIIADVLLESAIKNSGMSLADAVIHVATANPWDLAECLQRYLIDMTDEYGVDAGNGMRDLDLGKIPL